MQSEGPAVHFLNVEYFFRLIYALLHGGAGAPGDLSLSGLYVFISHLWLFVTVLAYLFSLAAIGVFVYATMRLYQVRQEEAPKYATRTAEEAHEQIEHSRWAYIMQLIESGQENEWRQAIIEADIILDELLTRLGYHGESVGEKLRNVNAAHFATLNNAWEAHRVRNEIAHQGSAYQLPERLAHRTIANYEAVFREHGEI
jgi:hypothetical protein